MKVLLLGSSGLVGQQCLQVLLAQPEVSQIVLPVRTPLVPIPNDKRVSTHIIDFQHLAIHAELFKVDAILCCLGTTIAKAQSKAAFEQVDVRIPLAAAALARQQGVASFGLVSAAGANSHSPFFYNRCKGMLEEGLQMLQFPSLSIARPSLLLGNRTEKRPAEAFAQKATLRVLPLIPAFWRPVGAFQVAKALVNATLQAKPGVHVLYNRGIAQIR
jgi:uncharacterized protein YbjT (DUF2867 family)